MSISTTPKCESEASTRTAFSWTFPGAPIRINISLDLISRLRAELDQRQNLANGTSRAEVGGVLLGHQDTPMTLVIDDYVWVTSEEQPSGRYHLDPSELRLLRSIYSEPVGYFRTQSEDGLHLKDEEIDFVGKHFRDPTDVVLLIRNSPQQYTAGFFFWMEAGVFAPFSFMDFPLDAELLRLQAKSRSTGVRVTQPSEEKETLLPLQEGQLKSIEPADITRPGATKNTKVRVSPPTLVAAGLVFALLPLAGLAVFIVRDRGFFARRQEAPATAAAFPLQLDVESQGNGLNIRWSPQSGPIAKAREAHLIIRENDQRPRMVPLDRQQLASGHIYYRSSAEQVEFQLEIVDTSGAVSRESVLALSSKPSASASVPVAPSR